jgi:hypothetical protein
MFGYLKNKIFIGIDPDIEKSGVAVYDTEDNSLELRTLPFWELIEELESYLIPIHVVVEAGHLIKKSNWHSNKHQSKNVGERIAKNVGTNHAVGILLEQYLKKHDISHELTLPKGKVKAEYFKAIWGNVKSNQETRDAAMLLVKYNRQ